MRERNRVCIRMRGHSLYRIVYEWGRDCVSMARTQNVLEEVLSSEPKFFERMAAKGNAQAAAQILRARDRDREWGCLPAWLTDSEYEWVEPNRVRAEQRRRGLSLDFVPSLVVQVDLEPSKKEYNYFFFTITEIIGLITLFPWMQSETL